MMNVEMIYDFDELRKFIADSELAMSEQGRKDFTNHAIYFYKKLEVDSAKLAILLLAQPQLAEVLTKKTN
jgi:hypothetical protein